MKKNKQYFLRMAIIKTMISGCFYLLMPLLAYAYDSLLGEAADRYFGYVIFGAAIMMLGNVILLVKSWALAFDPTLRRDYHQED